MSARVIQYPLGVDGTVTRVLECGDGPDVVICLHGAGSRADRWHPQLPLLASAGYRALAVDFPGHGLAERPAGYPYGTPAFTRFVQALIERIDVPRASLLGTSLGGHVAASVACQDPHRVTSTVLIGAVGLVPSEAPSSDTATPIADASLAGSRSKLEFLVHDGQLVTDELVREESMVNSSPGADSARAELGRYLVEDLDRQVVGAQYASLCVPTMLLWGAEDRWVPPSVGRRAAEVIPAAEFVLLPDAGHAPYFERPAEFFSAVGPFLEASRSARR